MKFFTYFFDKIFVKFPKNYLNQSEKVTHKVQQKAKQKAKG
jgi:hypothetical protein